MRVLPILFNTDMVRAILDGRKTVTRRVVKPRMPDHCPSCMHIHSDFIYDEAAQNVYCASCGEPLDNGGFPYKPAYQPGDILYVRVTWQECEWGYLYRAWPKGLHQPGTYKGMPWRPSIYMPKEAARIWLKVIDVRVERLKDITDEQILKEGANPEAIEHYIKQMPAEEWGHAAHVIEFKHLWDSTVKKADLDRYGWDANPWVWVIEFERCEKPEENESSGSPEWKDNFMQRFCKVN